jgi:hypothetical protein
MASCLVSGSRSGKKFSFHHFGILMGNKNGQIQNSLALRHHLFVHKNGEDTPH